ncbi:CobW/HypB/UreG, nucleotide-binding domain-containing protein [Haematococcus lacustris]
MCDAGAHEVQLSLTASSLALALQRLELACAFLLTDRLWAVAMADLAQLAVGLHANTAQRRLLMPPSSLSSPRPASLSPTASGPTAMGGQQGPGWVEKLEPFWQLFVTYVVEATAGTEHNLAWWMAAVKAGNAYLPDLVTPQQRAQPMNAKMLVGAAAQYVQEVRQQGEGGWEVLLAMAGRMRTRFRFTAAKIPKPRIAAGNGVTAAEQVSLEQAGEALVVKGAEAGARATGKSGAGVGAGAQTPPPDAANTSSPAAAAAAEPAQGASGAAGAVTGAAAAGAGAAAEPVLSQPRAAPQHMGGMPDAATQAANQSSSPEPGATAAGAAAGAAVVAAAASSVTAAGAGGQGLNPVAPHLAAAGQLDDGNSRLQVFMTSKRLATALLQHTPSIQLTHPLASLKFDLDDLEAGDWFLPPLVPVLASLPSLHTLLLLQDTVHGDQVDVLLAATQITHLQVYSIGCLIFSRVSAACSWRQLEVEEMDWLSAAHLPLHSLTHPLQLALLGGIDSAGAEVLAAAELNLCGRHKAGLEVEDMWLGRGSFDLLTKQHVVEGSQDTVMQLSNGCLCCTVRDDLIQALNRLVGGAAAAGLDALAQAQRTNSLRRAVQYDRCSEFDHIVIETTGLANPAPIISSFFMDRSLPDKVKLDGVVTVVDAKHVSRHLDTPKEAGVVNEAVEQIAFADRVLLNKTDLVRCSSSSIMDEAGERASGQAGSLGPLEARLQAINKMATITRAQRAQDKNERECVAAARHVFQLSLTASSLALALQRLELACAFLLTDRLWAVAMADLAQLAVGLHANTAQRRLLTTPSALNSPRPASLSPTASGPTAMGGQQGPRWVEKLEPFWQLFVTYVVEATAGTEHNLAWWMAAVKAGNAYLPDLVTPLQRAQPMNAKMLVGAAAQYVQEVSGAAESRMRKRFRSTAAKINNSRVAAVVSSLMQALVAAGEARCLRLHQQLGAACNVTSQGNGLTAVDQGRVQLLSLSCPSQQLRCSTWAGCLMLQHKLQTSHPVLSQAPLQQEQPQGKQPRGKQHQEVCTAQPQQASDVAKACEVVLT